jgi:tagaturonate epimerase
MSKVPPAATLSDDELAGRIDDFHTRQALHCTFGSVLTADDGARFRTRLYAALESDEEAHYAALVHHLGRHLAPFVQKR